jgi:glutamine synthetase
MNAKEAISNVKEHKVDIVRLLFTDILGRLKGVNVTSSELDRAVEEGIAFDGSSIEGFVRIEESDLILKPDPDSFKIFPFETGGLRSGFFFCDVTTPDGQPLPNDPRQVLRKMLHKASAMGYHNFKVGPELEFFYFPDETNATPPDSAGYFDIMPMDAGSHARDRTLAILGEMGITMEADHHEVAEGQHEIDFRYGDALAMADNVMISKMVVKQTAREQGLYATFMPKPVAGINGSGMHVHQSLFVNGTNAFYGDGDGDRYHLSDVGRSYLAGLLKYAPDITAVTNQWVNSYKRLVPGYEAPVYISWGQRNRTALVRVPSFKKGKGASCRVEYRAPDSAANPYLAFAVMLGAGLKGIESNAAVAPPIEANIFAMTEAEKNDHRITGLPGDLHGATAVAAQSALIKEILGEPLFSQFIANKEEEWERYRVAVTDYELKTYLPTL